MNSHEFSPNQQLCPVKAFRNIFCSNVVSFYSLNEYVITDDQNLPKFDPSIGNP
jgi:hypothetical protein